MSNVNVDNGKKLWARPRTLERDRPIRNAGSLYRTAEDGRAGVGGIPLVAVEDAVTATIRMAYGVAEAQIERSSRLAQRLRDAGDRAVGPGSDRKALDATEQLVFRSLMGGLNWLESAAAEGNTPVMRLMKAQYKLVGSLLGLLPTPGDQAATTPAQPTEAESNVADSRRFVSQEHLRFPKIVFKGSVQRAVRIRYWDVASLKELKRSLQFYCVNQVGAELKADLDRDPNDNPTLTFDMKSDVRSGVWKAAVCNEGNEQVGFIEIEL